MSLYDIPLTRLEGQPASLGDYQGQVLLIVNVASKCGLTPQYAGLTALYDQYEGQGLQVLAFPCNDFAGQEPGTPEEIEEFCQRNYGVRFSVFSKVHANGDERHDLYKALIAAQPKAQPKEGGQLLAKLAQHGLAPKNDSDVAWNFEKFLVGRDGTVIGRFAPDVTPDDPALVGAIEKALG
ncbi:MAG: glutathione peroxidase [Azospirillaceae bacterium]|nr:glutathione peroxidase [Azospirillaceae bacterium]